MMKINDDCQLLKKLGIHSCDDVNRELYALLKNIRDIYCRTNTEQHIILISDAVEQHLGYNSDELTGLSLENLFAEPQDYRDFIEQLNEKGHLEQHQVKLKHQNGDNIWFAIHAGYRYDREGKKLGIETSCQNIDLQKEQQSMLDHLNRITEQTADIVVITDVHGIIEYVNPAFEKITGFSPAEVLGKNPNLFSSDQQSEEFYAHMWSTLLAGKVYRNNLINKRKDGSLYHAEITITPLIDDNADITHFIATARDISDHIRDKVRLKHIIHHDTLTDLPNRSLFLDRLQQAISKAHHHHRLVAVLFLDLDRFKNINDSLGHTAGDQLLQQLGERFRATIREGDTIARFGGDEFVILLDDFDSDSSLSLIAQKILNSLATPFEISGHEIFITASIGISICPHDGEDPETLLRNADIAMYRAKELGKNNFQYYSESMTARVFERMTLENNLRHALERNEFILHYQPQVDARSGKIFGVEALLRWRHPELGLVMPNNFISLLEETGLIEPVGIWVLETACRQSQQWHESGMGFVHMSVNLSSRQFNNSEFISSLQNIIEETGVNPEYLELELTESMLMRNTSSTIAALKSLNDLGVRFAIDDFGTGYSSLNYLRRFPIETIKIDRSFIRDITHDNDDRAICSAIIGMTQSLSLNVIAEGVETDGQLDFLKTKDCHYIQGNVFSPAIPAEAMTKMLADQLRN